MMAAEKNYLLWVSGAPRCVIHGRPSRSAAPPGERLSRQLKHSGGNQQQFENKEVLSRLPHGPNCEAPWDSGGAASEAARRAVA